MAVISYFNLAGFDNVSINAEVDDIEASIEQIGNDVELLDFEPDAISDTQLYKTVISVPGNPGVIWSFEATGKGFELGVNPVFNSFKYTNDDGQGYEVTGSLKANGGVINSIKFFDQNQNYTYEYVGVIQGNSNFDIVSATIKTYSVTTDNFSFTISGNLKLDIITEEIVSGTVTGFHIDSQGNTFDVSGISMKYSDFDSLTNPTNPDLTALLAGINLNGNDSITGGIDDDHLYGQAGNDTLDGGLGEDTLEGGIGNDTYLVDDEHDVIIEGLKAGTDLVRSTAGDYVLGDNIENITLMGAGNLNATGNSLANTMTGNNGDNALKGEGGVDILKGGFGNDTYIVNLKTSGTGAKVVGSLEDKITELANQGTEDKVVLQGGGMITKYSTITLGADIEILDATETGEALLNLTGNTLNNILLGNAADNLLSGGKGIDSLEGGDGDDTLDGGVEIDLMDGGDGNDTYVLDQEAELGNVTEADGEGIDLLQIAYSNTSKVTAKEVDLADYANLEFVENVAITGKGLFNVTGNDQANYLVGNASINALTGSEGNDTLDGGKGADILTGGMGDDTYIVDSLLDVVTEGEDEGIDTIQSMLGINLSLPQYANIENVTLTGKAAINVTGNDVNNHLIGNDGANILDGGAGNDILSGGKGNDTYIVSNLLDTVIESVDEGNDTINAAFTYNLNLVANVENVMLLGTGDFNATGNALNNVLTGNAGNNVLNGSTGNDTLNGGDGNDTLNGGEGADSMTGGNGNDTYYFDNSKDIIRETSAAGGIDTVNIALAGTSFTTYVLGKYFENAKLEDNTDIINLYGNSADNVLYGNNIINSKYIALGYSNYIDGAAGNDEIHTGNVANSTVNGGVGNDTIYGGTGANSYLYGGYGNDSIIGGTASVVIEGAGGNDTLDGGTGTDRMVSYSYSTSAVTIDLNVALQATSKGAGTDTLTHFNNITGSQYNDTLTGDGTANFIRGFLGNDTIAGGNGNDTLWGEAGSDSLSGGSGDDILLGGLGNDTLDGGVGGSDTVTYATTLGATAGVKVSLETETAQNTGGAGTDTLIGIENLFGSSFADTLTGNTNANTLNGGDGNDTMGGGGGNDTLIGGAGNDSLIGGDGNDSITGGTGKDFLTGGDDDDIFVFNSSAESGIGSVADTITDFGIGLDKIDLSAIDANTSSSGTNEAFSFIGETADFDGTNDTRVPGQLRFEINDNDPNSISVFGDTNGDGAADFQIILTGITSINAGDFIL